MSIDEVARLERPRMVALDGTQMLAIYEGQLVIWPVSPTTGEPQGPVRHLTTEIAYNPNWAGDNRHVLYQANDKLRLMDIETGEVKTIPSDLHLIRLMCSRAA